MRQHLMSLLILTFSTYFGVVLAIRALGDKITVVTTLQECPAPVIHEKMETVITLEPILITPHEAEPTITMPPPSAQNGPCLKNQKAKITLGPGHMVICNEIPKLKPLELSLTRKIGSDYSRCLTS